MRVYLGGPSDDLDLVRDAAKRLRAKGHTITVEWWERVEEARRNGWGTDEEVPEAFMRESARANDRGILAAQSFVGLCRRVGGLSGGVAFQVGLSLGAMPSFAERFVVGNPRGHIAAYTDGVRVFSTLDEAIEALPW
jgi:hypothetical protein